MTSVYMGRILPVQGSLPVQRKKYAVQEYTYLDSPSLEFKNSVRSDVFFKYQRMGTELRIIMNSKDEAKRYRI